MAMSAAIFRRGGPKKELFLVTGEDQDEVELEDKLKDLTELLHADKSGKEMSAAIWRPSLQAAELVWSRRNSTRDIGFSKGRKTYLHIEEAVYLVDRSDLLLFVEAAGQQQRLLSLQEAYELMLSSGVSLERYIVYSTLNRSGYLVMRHPSHWILGTHQTPQDVWGLHAWARCYGSQPRLFTASLLGMPAPTDGQPTRVSSSVLAGSAGAGAELTHAVCHSVGAASNVDTAGAGVGVDVDVADVLGGSTIADVAPGSAGAGAVLASKRKMPEDQEAVAAAAQEGSKRVCTPASMVSNEVQHRAWWQVTDGRHPWLSKQADLFYEAPRVLLTPRLGDELRAILPHLRPFPPIVADQNLGPAADTSLLVFDVYKPGSHVGRLKGVFPPLLCHLAISSNHPPSLQDMRAADQQAQQKVPVKWLAVENGDVTWYGKNRVNLMHLM